MIHKKTAQKIQNPGIQLNTKLAFIQAAEMIKDEDILHV